MANELIAKGRVESLCINGEARALIDFRLDGPEGDKHKGFRRFLSKHDGAYRRTSELEKGAEVFNTRSWTGLSLEEMTELERALGKKVIPGILLENLVLSGVPGFSKLAPTTRLVFPMRGGTQAILIVFEENTPCHIVGKRLAAQHHDEELVPRFTHEAQGKRGVMGFVYSVGRVKVGDEVLVYPPVG